MAVIEIAGLRKEYRNVRGGRTVALDGLDLDVPGPGVFGFLGPNGAGKTTTVRCLLGLARPTAGTCRLLGVDCTDGLHTVLDRVGSIVEAPALFPGFSGRRNLEILARGAGIEERRIAEVLEIVGLSRRAKERVKGYSLGMRQRLAIAAALLKDPQVLILDEPANGLDPAGIVEVRTLLRGLGEEGRTVFVSSHILSEVRQMCDHVAIIARGRLVASGPVEEVLARGGRRALMVRVADIAGAADVLRRAGMDAVRWEGALRLDRAPADPSEVTRVLAQHGHYVSELRSDEEDLEAVFLKLTSQEEVAV
jgi:ABC-2 type transport system ATP-binding protein